jgi:hypothetical protein
MGRREERGEEHLDRRSMKRSCLAKRAAWPGEPYLMQGCPDHLALAIPVVHVGESEIADFAAVIVVEQHIFLRGYPT